MNAMRKPRRGGEDGSPRGTQGWQHLLVKCLSTIALVAAAPGLVAQRTWVVDDTGAPVTDFTTLLGAYQVAAPNDRIVVRYGSGSGYPMPDPFDKPLRILGEGASKPIIFYRDVSIRCPAYELLVLDNFEFRSWRFSPSVEASLGTVLFSRCVYTPYNPYPAGVYESKRMVLLDCDVTSGGPAIGAYASDLFLLNCRVSSAWSNGDVYDGAVSNHSSQTIRDGGTIWIVGGTYQGGNAYVYCFGNNYSPQSAVKALQGRAVIAGPASLRGGMNVGPCGNGSEALPFSSGCGPGLNGGLIDPMVLPPNSWTCTPLFHSHEMPAVIAGPAARGQRETLELWGPAHSAVALFASLLTGYDPIPTPFGDIWLNPELILHVGTGPVDAQRHLTMTTTIPPWLPIGEVLVYQAVSLSPAGQFEISAPGMAVVH